MNGIFRVFVCNFHEHGHDLGDPVFDGVGLSGFNSIANAFMLA